MSTRNDRREYLSLVGPADGKRQTHQNSALYYPTLLLTKTEYAPLVESFSFRETKTGVDLIKSNEVSPLNYDRKHVSFPGLYYPRFADLFAEIHGAAGGRGRGKEGKEEDESEIELNLGLSLGGNLEVDRAFKNLVRSSSTLHVFADRQRRNERRGAAFPA
nr:ninja-family protein AFP3-like [Ipomoea batatas]